MSRILHLDVPRGLTTTLRSFDFRSAAQFAKQGIRFDQADLNSVYWQFVLRTVSETASLDDYFHPRVSLETVCELASCLKQLNNRGIPISPQGLDFGHCADSTNSIELALGSAAIRRFLADFVDDIVSNLNLAEDAPQLVSLGSISANTLIVACAIAQILRQHLPRETKIVLGKHSYENFSLALREKDIRANGRLEKYFDHVIFHEEYFIDELLNLCFMGRRLIASISICM